MSDDIRRQAAILARKVEALDWLDANFKGAVHEDWCNYLDLTGHPAPCNCGAGKRIDLCRFIKSAIEKA
jgi:hypothetical protein